MCCAALYHVPLGVRNVVTAFVREVVLKQGLGSHHRGKASRSS